MTDHLHGARTERPTETDGPVRISVRYFAGARAAAGTDAETVRVVSSSGAGDSPGARVDEVIEALLAEHDEGLARVVAASSFLVDGVAVRDRSATVPHGAEFDVLPPFAGG